MQPCNAKLLQLSTSYTTIGNFVYMRYHGNTIQIWNQEFNMRYHGTTIQLWNQEFNKCLNSKRLICLFVTEGLTEKFIRK